MDTVLFIIFSFLLQGTCLAIGGRSSKGLKDQKDYYLASKGLRFFPLMMTFVATQVGGGLVLGAAEEAFVFGWWALLYPLGAGLGLLLLGCGLGSKLAAYKVSTIAELFEVVYCSQALKKIASLLSIISCFVILAAQIIASNKFMAAVGADSAIGFAIFWSIVIFYTSVGGLRAVVNTDLVQASFFMAVFLFSFAFALCTLEVPIWELTTNAFAEETLPSASSKLAGWLLMPLIFIIIGQDMGQRCFAADAPRTVSKATLGAAACTIVACMVPLYFGILAKKMELVVPEGSSVLMAAVIATTTPTIAALVGCAIIAAIISTADSLINAIASNVSQDFSFVLIKGNPIRSSQLLSASISCGAILFSLYFDNIVDLLIQSYELSASCLFIPLIFALFQPKGKPLAAASAVAFGAAAFIALRFISTPVPRELASVLISLLGYGLGAFGSMKMQRPSKVEEVVYE